MGFLDKSGLTYLWGKIVDRLELKVDKVTGKGLSENDYTTAEKTKLEGIATGATANVVENTLTSTSTTNALSAAQGKALSDTIATKLDYTQMNLGQDLNQIFGVGLYRSPSNVDGVSTIINKPSSVTSPFVLIVASNAGSSVGGVQTIFYGMNIFSRRGTSSGWGRWYKYTGEEE